MVQALTKLREAARLALTYGDHETSLGLGALRDVVRKLSVMPGNRNLVLVSPGFLLTRDIDPMSTTFSIVPSAPTSLSTRIDMRGLFTIIPGGDISDQRYDSADRDHLPGRRPHQAAATQADDILAELANGTGGTFFHNDNDLEARSQSSGGPARVCLCAGILPARPETRRRLSRPESDCEKFGQV